MIRIACSFSSRLMAALSGAAATGGAAGGADSSTPVGVSSPSLLWSFASGSITCASGSLSLASASASGVLLLGGASWIQCVGEWDTSWRGKSGPCGCTRSLPLTDDLCPHAAPHVRSERDRAMIAADSEETAASIVCWARIRCRARAAHGGRRAAKWGR